MTVFKKYNFYESDAVHLDTLTLAISCYFFFVYAKQETYWNVSKKLYF